MLLYGFCKPRRRPVWAGEELWRETVKTIPWWKEPTKDQWYAW